MSIYPEYVNFVKNYTPNSMLETLINEIIELEYNKQIERDLLRDQ